MFPPRYFPPVPQGVGGYIAVSATQACFDNGVVKAGILDERAVANVLDEMMMVSVKSSETYIGTDEEALIASFLNSNLVAKVD